jgi:hypothetical protein
MIDRIQFVYDNRFWGETMEVRRAAGFLGKLFGGFRSTNQPVVVAVELLELLVSA